MAFDQSTRTRLADFVGDARAILTKEFTHQLQADYGLNPERGEVMALGSMQLDNARRATAELLRETLGYYLANAHSQDAKARKEALERIVREQAFTVLNRLCALRMAEARGLLIESIGSGYQSKGFKLYGHMTGSALNETGDAYRAYLFSLFDEFAVDLAVLFDRFSPEGRLFPGEKALLALLAAVNHPDLAGLWGEDETIGWIYQYFNSQEERRKMRAESQAPRNSRELAVRNQFFTPRYVVEFLTDNTLGRTWYEMTLGETQLGYRCRYLVRRPRDIFLCTLPLNFSSFAPWVQTAAQGNFASLPEAPSLDEIGQFALLIDGYRSESPKPEDDPVAQASRHMQAFVEQDALFPADTLLLWQILFVYQRAMIRHGIPDDPADPFVRGIRTAYTSLRDLLQNPPTDITQEELLQQPVFIPRRPCKDPRTILLLDPACGSMHFGLYAFDLYETIYSEAWDLEEAHGPDALLRTDHLSPLLDTYPDKAAFLRDVPRLIVEHNIHGIDIDARAVQIAGLSLWLRAQRSWHSQGLKPAERPIILRSNIVCAEPMPGDKTALQEFIASLEPKLLGELVAAIFNKMELADEAGSLLKVDEEIRSAVDSAQNRYQDYLLQQKKDAGYLPGLAPERDTTLLDIMDLPDPKQFWTTAEDLVVKALKEYAFVTASGHSYTRRLFAQDAAQGFAFIDVCRKRYDVVLMNPPFGEFSRTWKKAAIVSYPHSNNDILAAFVDLFLHRLLPKGRLGAITSRTCFFLTTFADWRTEVVLKDAALSIVADLGLGVMDDAMVEAAAYVLEQSEPAEIVPFIRAIADRDREPVVDSCVLSLNAGTPERRLLLTKQSVFGLLPGSPFVYWVTRQDLQQLGSHLRFEPAAGEVRQGLATGDDFRFVRAVWEVAPEDSQFVYYPANGELYCRFDDPNVEKFMRRRKFGKRIWAFHVKSGASQPWYSPITLKINWNRDGAELRNFRNSTGKLRSRPQNLSFYYRPGFSWTRRAARFYPYIIPTSCIPSVSRYMAFPKYSKQYDALGIGASRIASAFLRFYGEWFERPNFLVETVKKLPWPTLDEETKRHFYAHISLQVTHRRQAYQNHEPFHEFLLPAKIQDFSNGGQTLAFDQRCLLDEESEHQVAIAYGLSNDSVERIERDVLESLAYQQRAEDNSANTCEPEDDDDGSDFVLDYSAKAQSEALISYLVGVVFGRWDITYATSERQPPPVPEPFDPLPACPPGMLQNATGLPATPIDVPTTYPLRISWSGILTSDPGHPEDIVTRVQEAISVIWRDGVDITEREMCQLLGVASLVPYFNNSSRFFDDHLKRYSKSRRVAPIYWPLGTISGSYTLWLYYHRLTDQSLYQCVNDFVDPKTKHVAEQVAALQRKPNRSREDERSLEQLAALERELGDFRAELLRVASFWKPNLNDGVQITAAPLYRLFNHRHWRNRLQETWVKLEAGEYDWAHLAYCIWPERVREKCRTDKSLAIAHNLEHLYIEPSASAKSTGRRNKGQAVQAEDSQVEMELGDVD